MIQRLTQNQRALLSAYFDQEASPRETLQAESLLASTDEARRYLDELRALDSLSNEVLAPVSVISAGVASSTKLTGSAIETAAHAASVVKGIGGLGAWGVAAISGTAVMIAVGVSLSLRSPATPDPQPPSTGISTRGDTRSPKSSLTSPLSAQQRINVDTNALIIPPMTDGEVISFALDGTLPIDTDRARYLCLEHTDENKLSVEVHNTEARTKVTEYADITLPHMPVIDSLRGAIRASLLKRNEGVVLRADMNQLRLRTLRELEKLEATAPQMPPQLRKRLIRRVQLALEGPERQIFYQEALEEQVEFQSQDRYFLIESASISIFGEEGGVWQMPQTAVVIDMAGTPFIQIDPEDLAAVETFACNPSVAPPPSVVNIGVQPEVHGVGAGGAPPRRRKTHRPPSEQADNVTAELTQVLPAEIANDSDRDAQTSSLELQLLEARKQLKRAREILERTEKKVEEAKKR